MASSFTRVLRDVGDGAVDVLTGLVDRVAGRRDVQTLVRPPHRIRRQPPTAIAGFPDGAVGKLVGRVEALGPTLVAPISGRPCVLYRVIVLEYRSLAEPWTFLRYRRTYRTAHGWRPAITEVDANEFVIDDGTGRAVIDPVDAQVVLTHDVILRPRACRANPRVHAYLERHGLELRPDLFPRGVRVLEGVLEVGAHAMVWGAGRPEVVGPGDAARPLVGAVYRATAPTRLRLAGTAAEALMISGLRADLAARVAPVAGG